MKKLLLLLIITAATLTACDDSPRQYGQEKTTLEMMKLTKDTVLIADHPTQEGTVLQFNENNIVERTYFVETVDGVQLETGVILLLMLLTFVIGAMLGIQIS